MKLVRLILLSSGLLSPSLTLASCPDWLNHDFRRLHANDTINICQQFPNQPLLLINTASHCGYTPQFSGLEALFQQYKGQGLVVVGFASDDFNQEDASEAKAASICYENFGVTFSMTAPIHVRGNSAHPLFKTLAEKSQAPAWNFNKYVVSADGKSVQYFGATTSPQAANLINAINRVVTTTEP